MIKIKRGLDIPLSGVPSDSISDAAKPRSVALIGYDYVGMKPTMELREGDRVRTGQCLFTDKKTEGVRYTAPASGVVASINRGSKRVFESMVIDVEADDFVEFDAYPAADLASLSAEQVKSNLLSSGLWTALRTRPFSKVPAPDTEPVALFVSAIDTNPLAGDPVSVIRAESEAFQQGLSILQRLLEGPVYLITAAGVEIPRPDAVRHEQFSGPHPAGLAGTHIHFLEPVHADKTVWTIGYQDVIAVGKLFTTGHLYCDRVVALGGPLVREPRLLRTRLGANLEELTAGELEPGEARVISGSVLSGRAAAGAVAYLGRYHNQVTVLAEGREREFFGWFSPGMERHSAKGIYLSSLFGRGKRFALTTSTHGSDRAIVPIGAYEEIMPLDVLATPLLKALVVGDTEQAQSLGALELDEEDLGLCSYVCPGKYEYGQILRDNLTRIEKEG